MMDRRRLPFSGRVAADHLRGHVDAERFVAGVPFVVGTSDAFLCNEPEGARLRQLVSGEGLRIYDRRKGWAFCAAGKDGYCGWLPEAALSESFAADYCVAARHSHLYPAPDIKRQPVCEMHFAAPVRLNNHQGRWAHVTTGAAEGFMPRAHLRSLDAPEDDPVAVAEGFLGTPYLWAGNTAAGIDCSGLVQVAFLACGIACPGDSDMQEAELGHPVPAGAALLRGDLVFWKGHVALVVDDTRLIHANAYHMAVAHERIEEAIDRIAAQGDGPVTSFRRVSRQRG